MQNYNPPYSFNYFAIMPYGTCQTSYATGGISGCMDNGPAQPTPVDLDTFASNPNVTSVTAKPLNLRASYVEMANLALQRQFGTRNTITLAYVGEFGRALQRVVDLDQPMPPGAGATSQAPVVYATQMPNVAEIFQANNGAMSSYNAMQVVYSRSLAQGLTVNANYTWSHNMTDIPISSSLIQAPGTRLWQFVPGSPP